jgi:hypothetical protein
MPEKRIVGRIPSVGIFSDEARNERNRGTVWRKAMTRAKSPTAQEIEKRAYELYLERGCADGHDVEDWLAAEVELSKSSPKPKARPARVGK